MVKDVQESQADALLGLPPRAADRRTARVVSGSRPLGRRGSTGGVDRRTPLYLLTTAGERSSPARRDSMPAPGPAPSADVRHSSAPSTPSLPSGSRRGSSTSTAPAETAQTLLTRASPVAAPSGGDMSAVDPLALPTASAVAASPPPPPSVHVPPLPVQSPLDYDSSGSSSSCSSSYSGTGSSAVHHGAAGFSSDGNESDDEGPLAAVDDSASDSGAGPGAANGDDDSDVDGYGFAHLSPRAASAALPRPLPADGAAHLSPEAIARVGSSTSIHKAVVEAMDGSPTDSPSSRHGATASATALTDPGAAGGPATPSDTIGSPGAAAAAASPDLGNVRSVEVMLELARLTNCFYDSDEASDNDDVDTDGFARARARSKDAAGKPIVKAWYHMAAPPASPANGTRGRKTAASPGASLHTAGCADAHALVVVSLVRARCFCGFFFFLFCYAAKSPRPRPSSNLSALAAAPPSATATAADILGISLPRQPLDAYDAYNSSDDDNRPVFEPPVAPVPVRAAVGCLCTLLACRCLTVRRSLSCRCSFLTFVCAFFARQRPADPSAGSSLLPRSFRADRRRRASSHVVLIAGASPMIPALGGSAPPPMSLKAPPSTAPSSAAVSDAAPATTTASATSSSAAGGTGTAPTATATAATAPLTTSATDTDTRRGPPITLHLPQAADDSTTNSTAPAPPARSFPSRTLAALLDETPGGSLPPPAMISAPALHERGSSLSQSFQRLWSESPVHGTRSVASDSGSGGTGPITGSGSGAAAAFPRNIHTGGGGGGGGFTPTASATHAKLGHDLLVAGHAQEAMTHLLKATQLLSRERTDGTSTPQAPASRRLRRGPVAAPEANLRVALKLQLAKDLIAVGLHEEGTSMLVQLLWTQPSEPTALYVLGAYYVRQRQPAAAVGHLRRLQALLPRCPDTVLALAQALLQHRRVSDCASLVSSSIDALFPDGSLVAPAAHPLCTRAHRVHATRCDLYLVLGQALAQLKHHKEVC